MDCYVWICNCVFNNCFIVGGEINFCYIFNVENKKVKVIIGVLNIVDNLILFDDEKLEYFKIWVIMVVLYN